MTPRKPGPLCPDCDGAGYLAYPTYERTCEACLGSGNKRKPGPLDVEPETAVRCPLCWAREGVRCFEAESYRSRQAARRPRPRRPRARGGEEVRAEVEQSNGTYLVEDHGEPECGKDFCDSCGDCLACFEDGCPQTDGGEHRWVVYYYPPSERP